MSAPVQLVCASKFMLACAYKQVLGSADMTRSSAVPPLTAQEGQG